MTAPNLPSRRCTEWLETLVAIDTVSRRSNLGLIETVRDFLGARGVAAELVCSRDRTKASLLATVGPNVAGGVLLSGHTDVVPVEGQDWESDPFRVVEREGLLYGRGTCDMKGFIAAVLACLEDADIGSLHRPVHLALSYDEEVGCLAMPDLVAAMTASRAAPLGVVVGEPTGMRTGIAHKGIRLCRTGVHATPRHSSQTHHGANAIEISARLIRILERQANEWRAQGGRERTTAPAYSTLSVNQIAGGSAINTVPGFCEFIWDVRAIDRAEADGALARFEMECRDLLAELSPVDRAARIETTTLVDVPPLLNGGVELARSLGLACGDVEAFPFATEAGFFEQAGLATIVCGPGYIENAHTANEYVSRAQLGECQAFLRHITAMLAASPADGPGWRRVARPP